MQGTVEAVSTKFGKYGVLVEGTWYNSKPEYLKVKPEKGDVIEFDNGGKNYLNKVSIITKSDAPAANSGGAKKGGYSQIGVELGHAANLAMQVMLRDGDFVEQDFRAITKDIFLVMKELRQQAETWGVDAQTGKRSCPKGEL